MNKENYIGICPLCSREMYNGSSVNVHHLIPKSLKGKETVILHKICHQKIHSLFTEKELQKKYNSIEKIRQVSEILNFINWIQKKDPDYYESNKASNELKMKKKAKKHW